MGARPLGWHAAPLLWILRSPWRPSGCVSTLGAWFLLLFAPKGTLSIVPFTVHV